MPGGRKAERRREGSWLLALVLLVGLVHLPALRCGYVYDDVEAILENPDLREWSRVGHLFFVNYWGRERNIGLYRPLVQLSYLVEGAGFGFEPVLSHLVNLLLHLGVVSLAFLLLRRLSLKRGVSFAAALFLGVHPALLDAAVWISGRTDVMSTGCVLLGLLVACRCSGKNESWRGRWSWILGLVYLLGLWSKEMAVTLPLLVLLLPGRGHGRRLPALLLALLVYLAFRVAAVEGVTPYGAGEEGVRLRDAGLLERVQVGSRACVRLLLFLPLPLGLAADHQAHPWAAADPELGPTASLSLLLLLLLFWLGLHLRRRVPALGFLLAGLPLSCLPVIQAIPIGAVMAERFLYLPAFFFFAGLVLLLARLVPWPGLRIGLVAAAAALVASITVSRIPIYHDRGSYCRDVLRAYPADFKAWNNFGVFHFKKLEGREPGAPDFEAAEAAFREALALQPGYRRGLLNLARARLDREAAAGSSVSLRPIEEWLRALSQRGDPDALYLLGKVSLRLGDRAPDEVEKGRHWQRAEERYLAAARGFEARPGGRTRAAAAWKEAGMAARNRGDQQAMAAAWRRALELDPEISGARAMAAALR